MRVILLATFLLSAACTAAHPLKMSYTAVKWVPGQNYISIEFRVFMDDIAVALQGEQRVKIDPFNNASIKGSLSAMTRYFSRHFHLKVDDVLLPVSTLMSFRMSEFNGTTFLYHVPIKNAAMKTFAVFNNILVVQYKEQQNMCQVRIGDSKYAQKFTASHTTEIISH